MLTLHAPEAIHPPKRPTVLCIDDDAIVLRFFQAFLESSGYRALATTDGLQGLALAHQDLPDMILLDVMMRGLSGFDICRKFRADPALRAIPIILLTDRFERSRGGEHRAGGGGRPHTHKAGAP